jgi:hypothetical protein
MIFPSSLSLSDSLSYAPSETYWYTHSPSEALSWPRCDHGVQWRKQTKTCRNLEMPPYRSRRLSPSLDLLSFPSQIHRRHPNQLKLPPNLLPPEFPLEDSRSSRLWARHVAPQERGAAREGFLKAVKMWDPSNNWRKHRVLNLMKILLFGQSVMYR